MKRTESSKAKISKTPSTSNINLSSAKSSELSNSSDIAKPKGSSSKRKTDFSKKKSFYSSSPNLLDIDYEGGQTNLLSSTKLNLSNSTPDLLEINTEPKRYSTGTPKRPPRSSSSSRGEGRSLRSGRLSLPSNPPIDSSKSKSVKSDKELMPPPSGLPKSKQELNKKNKQDVFLKRATQAKRQTSNDLTLDQAKSILLGKSGILENKKSQDQSISNSSLTEHSTSPTYLSNKDELSDPKIQGIATEIENTVSELRRKSIIDIAFKNLTELDASPLDLPERDISTKTVKLNPCTASVQQNIISAEVNTPLTLSKDSSEEETITVGVRERIAMLNAHSSPRSSDSSPRCSSPRVTSSTQINLISTTPAKENNPSSRPIQFTNISPPNSSGIGSSLDSDAATKMFSSSDGLGEDTTVSDSLDSTVTLSE